MKKKTQIILRKISQYCIYAILFITPILFLPFTSDYFEFNKSVLFIALTLIGLTFWTISLDPDEEISLWKSKLDKPTAILFATALIGLLLSQHHITSLIGFSGTLSNSFLLLVILIAFAFLVRNTLIGQKSIHRAFWFLVASGTTVAIITVLQYWGIFIFKYLEILRFTTYRTFTTLGYEVVLPFFLVSLIPIEMYLLFNYNKNIKHKIVLRLILFTILYAIILSSGKVWTWPAHTTIPSSALIIWIMIKTYGKKFKLDKKILPPLTILLSLLFLLHNIPAIENKIVTTQSFYSTQPKLSLSTSWKTLTSQYSNSAKDIIFGGGPDTYAYTFTKNKPASYSNSENAGIRFARSSTQVIEIASNYGILGIAAWGAFIYLFYLLIKKIFTTKRESEYSFILETLCIELAILLLAGFMTFYTSIIWIMIWLCIGLISTLYVLHFPREAERTALSLALSKESLTVNKQNVLPRISQILAILTTIGTIFILSKLYIGESYYLVGQNAITIGAENDAEMIVNYMQSNNYFSDAIRFFKLRDDYYSDRSIVVINFLKKSVDIDNQEGEFEAFSSEQNQLKNLSIDSLKSAVNLNPINVRNFKAAVYIYETLVQLTGGEYATELLGATNSGLVLDPNDPELHHKKGVLLYLANRDGAVEEIEKAIELDSLYIQARFDLATILQASGDFGSAQNQLEQILQILEEYGLEELDIYNELERDIKDYERGFIPENFQLGTLDKDIEDIEEGIEEE